MGGMAAITSPVMARPGATRSQSRRRLIINADDLGLSESVNRGIIECAEHGVVTSASMIVNMPGLHDAIARLHATHADLGVGLHFNIVAGRPLTSAQTITDPRTGRFYSMPQLGRLALTGKVSREDVGAECAAQLRKLQAAGIPVTHIDSHRHVHALPGIGVAVLEAAHAFGIGALRTPLEPLTVNVGHWRATLKKMVIGASWHLTSTNYTLAQRPRFPRSAGHFFGISLQGGYHFAERLNNVIDRLPVGTSEIMVHPGYSDAALAEADGYTWQRQCEIEALTSAELRDRLQRLDIELVSFGALHA